MVISENGGPRCCKRNSNLAIYQATAFVKEKFGITMELPEYVLCEFLHRNIQCKKISACIMLRDSIWIFIKENIRNLVLAESSQRTSDHFSWVVSFQNFSMLKSGQTKN